MQADNELKALLGRYELIDEANNHRKQWTCEFQSDGSYSTNWGRIGASPQSKDGLNMYDAMKKIREKIGKGYCLVENQFTEKFGATKPTVSKSYSKKREKKVEVPVELLAKPKGHVSLTDRLRRF